MSSFIAYTRVSTLKQGAEGVSLQEQKRAIERYAAAKGLSVSRWFIETKSAASRKRRVFQEVVELLRQRRATGLIIHKIDRGARNLRDWADLGELMDEGIDVRFANDELDLRSRGGRLAADIQAVVAADFIRNLREETLKGMQGRLRQGLYPFAAPAGYLDCGGGRPKAIDPDQAAVVKEMFALYATGAWSLRRLGAKAAAAGLRSRAGKARSTSAISKILHNPFYAGIIRVGSHEEVIGLHEPLVDRECFERVQTILRDRTRRTRMTARRFRYSGLLRCVTCSRSLPGETQKGHVYYRCHGESCRGTCLREERVTEAICGALSLAGVAPAEPDAEPFREQVVSCSVYRKRLSVRLAGSTSC